MEQIQQNTQNEEFTYYLKDRSGYFKVYLQDNKVFLNVFEGDSRTYISYETQYINLIGIKQSTVLNVRYLYIFISFNK